MNKEHFLHSLGSAHIASFDESDTDVYRVKSTDGDWVLLIDPKGRMLLITMSELADGDEWALFSDHETAAKFALGRVDEGVA